MKQDGLESIKNHLTRLEKKIDELKVLAKKSIIDGVMIKKEIENIKKDETKLARKETMLESDEKQLVKGVKKIELEEKWVSELQFYCHNKLLEDGNIVLCGRFHTKKVCNFENCPLKDKIN